MKDTVIQAVIDRWEQDAKTPDCLVVSSEAGEMDRELINQGIREGKRECAEGLRMLLHLLKE